MPTTPKMHSQSDTIPVRVIWRASAGVFLKTGKLICDIATIPQKHGKTIDMIWRGAAPNEKKEQTA